MALSAVAEKARSIGPKSGGAPQGTFSSPFLYDRRGGERGLNRLPPFAKASSSSRGGATENHWPSLHPHAIVKELHAAVGVTGKHVHLGLEAGVALHLQGLPDAQPAASRWTIPMAGGIFLCHQNKNGCGLPRGGLTAAGCLQRANAWKTRELAWSRGGCASLSTDTRG